MTTQEQLWRDDPLDTRVLKALQIAVLRDSDRGLLAHDLAWLLKVDVDLVRAALERLRDQNLVLEFFETATFWRAAK